MAWVKLKNLIDNLKSFRKQAQKMIEAVRGKDLPLISSAVAFTTTLSIVPLVAISFSVFKYFGGVPKLTEKLTSYMLEYLAAGTTAGFVERFNIVLNRASGKTLTLVGFLALAYGSTRMISQVERGMQKIWDISLRRTILNRTMVYVITLFVIPLLIAFGFGYLSSEKLSGQMVFDTEVMTYFFVFMIIYGLNQWIPNTKVSFRAAFLSSLLVAVSFFTLHRGFLWITKNILLYNKIYGSFASIPIFLVWLQWSWLIFFFGVLLCSTLHKKFFRKNTF